ILAGKSAHDRSKHFATAVGQRERTHDLWCKAPHLRETIVQLDQPCSDLLADPGPSGGTKTSVDAPLRDSDEPSLRSKSIRARRAVAHPGEGSKIHTIRRHLEQARQCLGLIVGFASAQSREALGTAS